MDNTKILKKQIKLLNKQVKGLEKEKKKAKQPKVVNVPNELKKRTPIDLNKIKAEIESRRIEGLEGSVPEGQEETFYHVAKIIKRDVETDKQKQLLYDKCKLFDDIFVVLDKYVDEVVDVHKKLDEKGVSLGKSWDMAKSVKENLKKKYVHGIDYNPDRLKGPQEQHLEVVSPNKKHVNFDPVKAQERIQGILDEGKLKDVIADPKRKSQFISIRIDGVEKLIPKKTYQIEELKLILGVPLTSTLKRAIVMEGGRTEFPNVEQGKDVFVDEDDRIISVAIGLDVNENDRKD